MSLCTTAVGRWERAGPSCAYTVTTDSQQRKSVSMLWAMNRALLRTFIILILKREQN